MDRQALGGGQKFAVGRNDGARKIPGDVQDAGASGAQQGIGHLARDALQPIVEKRQSHAIASRLLFRISHGFLRLLSGAGRNRKTSRRPANRGRTGMEHHGRDRRLDDGRSR